MPHYEFPRPAVTVDLVAFKINHNQLNVLLIKRSVTPFKGKWTLPGGYVHEHETLENCATRVLDAKAGITDVYLEQLYTFGAPKRDPRDRTISVAYLTVLAPDRDTGVGTWHAVEGIQKLGFDHSTITAMAVDRLRSKLTYSNIGLEFMPATFTLGELQRAWEAILSQPIDKRNFRKTILNKNYLTETGNKSKGGAHPPAKLYRRS